MARQWSKAEDQLLRRLYADQQLVEQIAIRLGRSADAVVARRQTLGVPPRRRSRPWSTREDALLRAGTAAGVPASWLAERLGWATEQVRLRRRELLGSRSPGRPYLPYEDESIRICLAERDDLEALARRLSRSPDAVRLRAQHLGVHRPPARRRWTEWEDALIRDGYTSALSCGEISRELPARSAASIASRARKLGLATYARRWSIRDDQRLAQLTARGVTLESVAQQLGRTPEAIRRRALRLGAKPPAPMAAQRRARCRWTREDDELLRLHHAMNPARLAELLGRSDAAVCRRLCALGLRAAAQRSPHHPVRRTAGLPTPGEQALIERDLPQATPRRRAMILRRLDHDWRPSAFATSPTSELPGQPRPVDGWREATPATAGPSRSERAA